MLREKDAINVGAQGIMPESARQKAKEKQGSLEEQIKVEAKERKEM